MTTGRVPFKRKSPAETMNAVINEPHTPVSEFNPDVPPGLSAVIDRALAKDPSARYQSMEAMLGDLWQVAQAIGLTGSEVPGRVITPYVPPRRHTVLGRLRRWAESPARAVPLALAACVVLVGLAFIVYSLWPKQPAPPAPIKSIAVLPFKPLVAESRDELLEMGMADTLITRLSNIRQVIVRPMSAVRKYTELEQDAVAVGREQRVDAILEGRIQRSGDKVRVTVRLVKVADEEVLWAGQFDEKFTDIFAVQDSISERVAAALALKLTGEEQKRLTKRYTDNTVAYQLYLKGRYNWNKTTEEGLKKAIDFFNQAIEKDPSYALAYAGLADAYTSLDWYGVLSTKEANPRAKAAAIKALEIDETLAEAHASLAAVRQYEWDWAGAEREYQRAIGLNPNYAVAHQWYGVYLAYMGRMDEGIAEMTRAQELDPLSLAINAQLGFLFYLARRYDQAIEQCQRTLEMEPGYEEARIYLAWIYVQKGMYEEAIAQYQKLKGDIPDVLAMLGAAYAVSGQRGKARDVLAELKEISQRRYVPPVFVAAIYTGLGDKDQAFAWLEKAYEDRDESFVGLKVLPLFDPLRSDQRFADLLRRMGLVP